MLLAARRVENLLVTFLVPVVLLVFLTSVPLLPEAGGRAVDRLVPGIVAVAVMSTGLVALGIATAYERGYGVLKRLLGSPLPRWALLSAKGLVVALTVAVQVVLIALVGLLLGWEPADGIVGALGRAVPWLLLGSLCFAAMGLLLAGLLRPETVLAVANGLFLGFLLVGGMIVPLERLPRVVAFPASLLPPALLNDLLRTSLGSTSPGDPVAAAGLAAWTVALAGAALVTFRAD